VKASLPQGQVIKSVNTDMENEADPQHGKVKSTNLHPRTAVPSEVYDFNPLTPRRQSCSVSDVSKTKKLAKSKPKLKKSPAQAKDDSDHTTVTDAAPPRTAESPHIHSTGDAQVIKDNEKLLPEPNAN